VNYDHVASEYDRRYALHEYAGVLRVLLDVAARTNPAACRVLEVGCGTGKWLSELERKGFCVAGIDPSAEMVRRCASLGDLRIGHAEELPWEAASFDLVVCVNALHHFRSPRDAIVEAHRVLRPGGAFVSIGLDPVADPGRWYVYDFFPTSLQRDLERFPTQEQRQRWLVDAGFEKVDIAVAERIRSAMSYEEALAQGILARSFTSQLTELSDAEYADGLARIQAAAARDESLTLVAELDLYATCAWKAA
jgi:SAM-dependent methyltransferase